MTELFTDYKNAVTELQRFAPQCDQDVREMTVVLRRAHATKLPVAIAADVVDMLFGNPGVVGYERVALTEAGEVALAHRDALRARDEHVLSPMDPCSDDELAVKQSVEFPEGAPVHLTDAGEFAPCQRDELAKLPVIPDIGELQRTRSADDPNDDFPNAAEREAAGLPELDPCSDDEPPSTPLNAPIVVGGRQAGGKMESLRKVPRK